MGSVALQRVPQGLTAAAIGGVAGAALGYVLGTGLGVGGSLGLAVGATLGGLAAGAYAHLAGPAVSADVAAERIHLLLANNPAPGQQVNYCTALTTSGDIYISKVKGVTANTAYLTATIGPLIRQANLHVGRSIFLAQEFNKDVGSNHAEMCIMAAACASGHQLTVIYCTGPHCAFCACMMRKAGIRLGAAGGGVDQEGWAHPFVPVSFGSQSGDTRSQLRALDSWRLVPSEDEVTRAGQEWRFSHPRGKSTRWL